MIVVIPKTMNDEKRYTLEELAQFDGKDGRPAYFAVEGVVYDATNSRMWRNGTHVRLHEAGGDLTRPLMAAPHPADRLDNVPRVGVLAEGEQEAGPAVREEDVVPFFARFLYGMHAHPASVHFPIALCVIAGLLEFVGLVLDCPGCHVAASYNLVLGLLFSPVSIVSGVLDWKYQFGGRLTNLFVWKYALTALFIVVAVLAVALLAFGAAPQLYRVAVIALAPVSLGLGFVGGRLTFPSA